MEVADLAVSWSNLWIPPIKVSLSKWAEEHFILSSAYSARSGPITLYEYQKDILDAFTDDRVQEIVLMVSTQMVKSIAIQIATAYVISVDPSPILIIQPTDSDSRAFAKERLDHMLKDMPVLQGLTDGSSKTGQDTILQKHFPGGSLSIVGSQAPGNVARRSIRYLFCDEVSKYPPSAGSEGDVIVSFREPCVNQRQ